MLICLFATRRRHWAVGLGGTAFAVVFVRGFLAEALGFPVSVWLPLMLIGLAVLGFPLFKTLKPRDKRVALVALGSLALLFKMAMGSTPLCFNQGCTQCSHSMSALADQIEDYRAAHGQYPENLDEFTENRSCVPQKASWLGRKLYGMQGVNLVPYSYHTNGDQFELICQSGTHFSAPGYPRYTNKYGLEAYPPRS